ncbi:MAG: metal ABC transporter ATP-binding protein [bacterium]|nr:metal ABC transporter ATP-binding protein [bacterium]
MTVAYQQKPVLWDVEYDAPEGSLIAVVGPNGAGKSTLIKACLGLIPLVMGEVAYWGVPYNESRLRVGYVPQRESVDWDFPVSVADVVTMGRYGRIGFLGRVRREHRDAAMSALDKVGMADFAGRQISQLSGGQQQRVFLARALAQEAELYFMDEPFVGVDAATEQAIVDILMKLRGEGATVICVHHDLSTVTRYFDQVILLNTRVVAQGPVKDVFNEDNLQKTYGGRLTILEDVSQAMANLGRGGVEL